MKAILGSLLMPLPFAVLLAVLGLILLRLARRVAGVTLVAVAGVLLIGACESPIANRLLLPLESRYAPVLDARSVADAPRYIVVLGAGYRPRAGVPVTSALNPIGVVRLTEGIRLFRQLSNAKLIVSGGTRDDRSPTAEGYALAAVALGVPPEAIIQMRKPLDTRAEVQELRARVQDAPVLVVTSAAHMPRAMQLCAALKVHAIPAPTDHLVEKAGSIELASLIPSGLSLRKTETAVHEYLGLLALWLGLG